MILICVRFRIHQCVITEDAVGNTYTPLVYNHCQSNLKVRYFCVCYIDYYFFSSESLLVNILDNKDNIYNYMEYDYVGAPWRNGNVGNGGLSLRRKSKMLEVLDNCYHMKMYTPTQLWNEDAFFSEKINHVMKLHKPSFEDAKKFSVETVFSDESFGIHCCWKWLNHSELSVVSSYCPNLIELIKLNQS